MVEDICFHILDLVQNSVAAGAKTIRLLLREKEGGNEWSLEVADNGRGMDEETLAKAQDPFFTSKSFKKVGLGLPLLQATTQFCGGDFLLRSRPGEGTSVQARFDKRHPDCPPLGKVKETLLGLWVSLENIDFIVDVETTTGNFHLSTSQIRNEIGDLHLSHPDVYSFLQEFLSSELDPLLKEGK